MSLSQYNSSICLPNHIAITMDGNGRWAIQKGRSRLQGHRAGAEVALDIVRYCRDLGIGYVTLYMFSSENWKRPQEEVLGLMDLFDDYLNRKIDDFAREQIRVRTIGDVNRLPLHVQKALFRVCQKTNDIKGTQVILALSYGGRDEITRTVKTIAQGVQFGNIAAECITEDLIAKHLDTKEFPEPDLFIRTGGELRLSNFLLWQMSYTELYFTPTLWPDFRRTDLDKAISEYTKRERRFGASLRS